MLFFAYFPYYFLVCLVDFRHINGVQIHLRCLYGVMPHALADYWNGYVHVSRYACPCMPCGICGEWHFQPCNFTYLLQIIVDVLQHTMILFLFGSVILLNNRKKIGTGGIYLCVSVDYFLRLFYPFHRQILVGLLAAISQHFIFQVLLPQIDNVDERHSSHIETEHKHVTGKGL